MSLKKIIKTTFNKSVSGKCFLNRLRVFREKICLLQSDISYISQQYKTRFNHDINFKDPKTFQEKLQWLKLFYRDERMPICSDKAELHNYLDKMGMSYLSNKILGIYENAKDIDFDSLPNMFVAKANHGSGWNLVCKNKKELKWSDEVNLMNSWLKLNLYVFGREWNYKNIKPKIVIEKFLDHQPLNDYKYMCFNGEPLYMQLNNDHDGEHFVDFYQINDWKHLPCTYGPYHFSQNIEIEKPLQHSKLMELARVLSKPFPFVRVDFYNFDNTIILGELTFFPGGGLWPFMPRDKGEEWDYKIGEKLILPKPNYNLDLLSKFK